MSLIQFLLNCKVAPHVLWSPMHVNGTERVEVTPFDLEVFQDVVDEFWEGFSTEARDSVPLGSIQDLVGVS